MTLAEEADRPAGRHPASQVAEIGNDLTFLSRCHSASSAALLLPSPLVLVVSSPRPRCDPSSSLRSDFAGPPRSRSLSIFRPPLSSSCRVVSSAVSSQRLPVLHPCDSPSSSLPSTPPCYLSSFPPIFSQNAGRDDLLSSVLATNPPIFCNLQMSYYPQNA